MDPNPIIPLFPLNTVLFPGQVLPLHIFEMRYRDMIQECLEKGINFGVVLIREGKEVGETADPYEVGTTARIHQVDRLEDGRMNIICVGDKRFRITQSFTNQPYLTGLIDYWPWETGAAGEIEQLHQSTRQQLVAYLEKLSQLTGTEIRLDGLPEEPLTLACLASIALRISNREKQELLAAPNLRDLMELVIMYLSREIHALKVTPGVPSSLDNPDAFIHLN